MDRFNVDQDEDAWHEIVRHPEGDWVTIEDAQKLEKQIAELEEQLKATVLIEQSCQDQIAGLEATLLAADLHSKLQEVDIAELIDKGGKQADNSCVKCGSKELNTSYIKNGEHITSSSAKEIETEFLTSSESSYYYSITAKKEHLHKHCRNCQYSWNEQVLQAKAKEESDEI